MTSTAADLAALHKVRKGSVDIVDVPECGYVVVEGVGAPDGPEFASATQALYAVSYGAHFIVKKQRGAAPKVMPLEAQWWVDDPDQQDIVVAVARRKATMARPRGRHHEIYLGDPRRSSPEKLCTILRNPVEPLVTPPASNVIRPD